LVELVSQTDQFAIRPDLLLVTANDFDRVLGVRLQLVSARLLTLRGHGGDY
jgi:hypothetical protein